MNTPIIKRFYKDPDNRWYIDLPEYIDAGLGDKANLEMVAGADLLLDKLANDKNDVLVRFNDTFFDGYEIELSQSSQHGYDDILEPEDDPGGWYTIKDTNTHLWLCPVTLYVFNGAYPKSIFLQVIKSTSI